MHINRKTVLLLLFLLVAIMTFPACAAKKDNEPKPLPPPQRFQELYPENLARVTRIVMRSGSTGELRAVTEPAVIAQWSRDVENLVLTPDPNQEGRSGFLFSVKLYEGEQETFSFTPGAIGGFYYQNNEQFTASIRQLYDEHATRIGEQ